MIKIDRDSLPPVDEYKIQPNKGLQKWRCAENKVLKDYKRDSTLFERDEDSYDFPKHPSYDIWRKELINCQGKKCCYCEKPITNGQLEHFRPKKGWQQKKGDSLIRPGYYWLTYRWNNLLLSCSDCNESGQKGNLFPISGKRAITLKCKLENENHSLINPYDENPSKSVSFNGSDIIHRNIRGKLTIDTLKLNQRIDLVEPRRDKFDAVSMAYKISLLPAPIGLISQKDIDKAKNRIRNAIKSKSPFAGMIKENIRNGTI